MSYTHEIVNSNILCNLYSNRLLDPNTSTEIANYPIYKILFCVRGHDGTTESDCFAFTESHYNAEIFRIHVFRCQIREAVRIQTLIGWL